MKIYPYILTLLMLTLSLTAQAQSDRQLIRSGNRLYRQQNYPKAEVEYRKALGRNPRNTQAMYNLGCALMSQQKDSAAIVQFEQAGQAETAPYRKAKAYHNIGVICQQHQMYTQAINAYKEALRNNPTDDQTRYNLALCQRLLKNQKKNGGGGQNNKNKDKGKDKQNKDKQKKQNKNQNQQDKQNQPSPKQMSKDNAEQLLNAAMQQEKATQQKLKKAEQQRRSRQLEKQW